MRISGSVSSLSGRVGSRCGTDRRACLRRRELPEHRSRGRFFGTPPGGLVSPQSSPRPFREGLGFPVAGGGFAGARSGVGCPKGRGRELDSSGSIRSVSGRAMQGADGPQFGPEGTTEGAGGLDGGGLGASRQFEASAQENLSRTRSEETELADENGWSGEHLIGERVRSLLGMERLRALPMEMKSKPTAAILATLVLRPAESWVGGSSGTTTYAKR